MPQANRLCSCLCLLFCQDLSARNDRLFTTLLISRFVAINKPKEMQFLIQIKEKVVLGNCLFYLDLKQIIVITKTLKNREGFLLKGQRYLTSLLGFLWRVSSKLYPRRHVIQLIYLPLSHILRFETFQGFILSFQRRQCFHRLKRDRICFQSEIQIRTGEN